MFARENPTRSAFAPFRLDPNDRELRVSTPSASHLRKVVCTPQFIPYQSQSGNVTRSAKSHLSRDRIITTVVFRRVRCHSFAT